MLRRLELVGFKSFADKTTFNFGDGITAIVGPNGSGKSNIVDAVRWILGEQSAKSLRGGEMADVIFNGSTSRRSFGMAEVTMTFDNSRRRLATEADEVQITRRVYRTGEGEYLINQQVCRLRDIKELFLGSGAGHDAYCIIEQGKVDVLLQASTKERRTIFEEAAGISRFKAKKIETLRKLERVDQNLQRLKDIVDEVEKQLRSVKLQAAKAERFQEYSNRLKELRLGLGLEEYQQLSEKLDAETALLDNLKSDLEQRAGRAAGYEQETQNLERGLAGLDDRLHDQEARLAAARQHIKTQETTLGHEDASSTQLDAELAVTRARLTELSTRVAGLSDHLARAQAELADAETQAGSQRDQVRSLEDALQARVRRLAELQHQVEADKAEHFAQMRRAAHLQNEAVASRAQVDNLRREQERLRHRSTQAAESLASLDVELQELAQADEGVQARLNGARQSLAQQRQEQERLRQLRDDTSEHVSRLRQERSGLASRVEVLQGLIRSHEGLGAGVREVFALLEQPEPGPWSNVLGMIADFLTVRREYAPLIDLALGDWAQRFVVRDIDRLLDALGQQPQLFSGRVSFLPLTPPCTQPGDDWDAGRIANPSYNHEDGGSAGNGPHAGTLRRWHTGQPHVEVSLLARTPATSTSTPAHPGVIARAEQLVTCDNPELADLPAQLLGRTLIVRDLAGARVIAAQGCGYRLITLHGEMLEADGTLTVGSHHAETGILSRKSELQELRQQLFDLDHRIFETERDLADLRERLSAADVRAQEQQEEIAVLAEQAADLRSRLERHRDRRQGLHEEVTVSLDEISRVEQEMAVLEKTWQESQTQATAAEAQVQFLHDRLHAADREMRELELDRQARQQEHTAAHVSLAKVEERLSALAQQHQQLAADLHQRRLEQTQSEQGLTTCKARLADSQRAMLQASALLAQGYLDKEAAEHAVAELIRQRDHDRQERSRLADLAHSVRNEWQVQSEHIHSRELEANDLRHRRDTLADRIREDYQVDLAELHRQSFSRQSPPPSLPEKERGEGASMDRAPGSDAGSPPPLDAAAVNEEIAELRRKLGRLGNVNLQALDELTELENRARTLHAQFDDLTAAKRSLEEIIAKINQDSRRLFQETFTTIRTHFQELFRKLFGGGMADIVIEDDNDILESGIEIIARPPGKELRSISLMSGGEKTLTAVALLLAIFRSKPSPFCILDEVDAALDEANIGRYTAVIREFLDLSQFIIVTHSKKTMAAADVLYGITMQESGISKQVSVRFEDWPDDPAPADATRNGEAEAAQPAPADGFGGK
jgi:chromosome segregation protein